MPLMLRDQATDGARLRLEANFRDVGPAAPCGMGCSACIDYNICGGLRLEKGFWDCSELCCGMPASCSGRMCRFNRADYARRHAEVGGFDLGRIGRAPLNTITVFPVVVPMIYHGKRRHRPFEAPAVAVRLRDLYRRKDGTPRFASRAEFFAYFCVAGTARIIVTGIDNDAVVERWWSLSERRMAIMRNLKDSLRIDLMTVPNFSLAVSWPRWSDLYSMKRIGLSWQELASSGMATALHPNGRTDADFERWKSFIAVRPEITHLSFEFTTGAGGPGQREKYAARLIALASAAQRPLHLIVTGGQAVWPRLAAAFESLTVIETSIFMKTHHRQQAMPGGNGGMRYKRVVTAPGAVLDELLAENAATIGARVAQMAASQT